MAKQLQLRRGTTAQHNTFTGAVGEVTIDTDKDVVVVHDGATAGGFPSQKQLVSGTNIKTINDTSLLGSGNISIGVSSLSDTSISSPLSGQVLSYDGVNWANVTFSALDAYSKEDTDILLAAKQATLVSGTNIKTVNSTTLLGSGDVAVQEPLVSGTNIRTINSTSLLGSGDIAVQPTLVSGTNIKTINSTSLLGSGNISITETTWVANDARAKTALNASGTAPIYACRAWVNFNGTGTVAIRASGNVSSITDNGTGLYTVNFTTSLPDVNYCVCTRAKGASNVVEGGFANSTYSTSSVQVQTFSDSGGGADTIYVNVAIFR